MKTKLNTTLNEKNSDVNNQVTTTQDEQWSIASKVEMQLGNQFQGLGTQINQLLESNKGLGTQMEKQISSLNQNGTKMNQLLEHNKDQFQGFGTQMDKQNLVLIQILENKSKGFENLEQHLQDIGILIKEDHKNFKEDNKSLKRKLDRVSTTKINENIEKLGTHIEKQSSSLNQLLEDERFNEKKAKIEDQVTTTVDDHWSIATKVQEQLEPRLEGLGTQMEKWLNQLLEDEKLPLMHENKLENYVKSNR